MPIFSTTRRSMSSVTVAEYPTNNQVISNLLLTIRPLRAAILAVLLVFVGGWSSVAFAAWSGSGQGTNVGGTWYVYDDSSEKSKTAGGAFSVYFDELTLAGPGATVSFQAKRTKLGTGNLVLRQYNEGWSDEWSDGLGTSYPSTYYSKGINYNSTKIQFYIPSGSLKKYYRNLKVTMAQYLENPSETSLDCGTNELGKASTNNSVTVAWCNVPAMGCQITDDADGVFSVEVSNNSEAGKYNTATFTVTCNHTKKAGDHTAKLVITDTYGNYNKTVNLSATTTKHPNKISWTADEATKKNWGESVEMSPTASNTDYTNYPIVLTSSNTSYATVSGHMVTFLAAGEGKTVTIYANQATSATYLAPTQVSKTFTIKQSQTIVWDETKVDPNIQINKSRDITGYAYGDPSGRAITYSSADPSKISVDGNTITANALGDVDIIATLAEDADYNEVTSSKTFTVKEKETIELYFDGVIIPADGTTINLKVGETSGYVTSKNATQVITYTSTNSGVAIYDATAHRIEAKGAGSADVTLAQEATDDYQAGSRKVTVNVSLNTTTISTTVSEKTMEVGDTYDPGLSTTNDEVSMNATSTDDAVAVYEDGVIKAKGAGSATITFSQAANYKWTGDTKSIAVTVNKKNPNLTVSGVPATAWNATIEPVITSANTDVNCPITITRISGVDRTARVDGSSIRVYDNNGQSATFRVSQSGNDMYLASSKEFTITAQKANKHVTFTMDETLYNALKGSSSGIQSWNGGIMVGDKTANISNAANYDDKYMVVGPFEGVPYQLSCNYTCSGGSTGKDWRIYESSDGSNWGEAIMSVSESGTLTNRNLDPSTRYLKFFWSGNYAGYFKNIIVTERRGIEVEDYDFGNSFEVGNPATDRAISLGWYSVPTTTVTSSNPGVFDVITETIDSRIDEFDPSTSITIRYHHKKVTEGDFDEATITLTSENGYTKTFKVKGKTIKKNQTLIWQDELSPISVGDVIPNPAIAPLALNYSIASTTEEGVVEMEGTVLKAMKPGTITLHVSNEGDAMWNPISGDYTIKVTDLKVQRIDWDQTFTRLTTSDVDFDLTASAYEYINDEKVTIDARPVTYSSDNTSVVTVVGGKLHVVGKGTANLTASVAGVEGEYEPASITRKVNVRVRSTGCTPHALENEAYNMKTAITDVTGTEKVYSLKGIEPAALSFKAWREAILGFSDGNIFVAQSTDNGSHWTQLQEISLPEGEVNAKSCGPIALDREATHIKLYKKTGATGWHNFKEINVTKAKYLELEDTKNRTETNIDFPAEETHIGQTYIKSVVVNYSNIFDMLYVNHTNPNFRITPTEIGNKCGEDGRATVTIIYYAKEPIDESDEIIVTDEHGLMATIHVHAEVSKSDQTISWNPETELKTTDVVTFNATASSGQPVTYSLAEGDEEVAELSENGELTIKTSGEIHVTASQEGSGLYNSVALEPVTMHISKVTPSVSVKPVASPVTLPAILGASSLNTASAVMLNDKGAAVAGEYAWEDNSSVLSNGTQDYNVRFSPSNTAWYNNVTFPVAVTASKRDQVITWDFSDEQTLLCSAIVPLNAVLTDGFNDEVLDKTLSYVSNNDACAEVIENELVIKTPGTIVITVSRAEDATYNAASITRTITFEKATPEITALPTANSIYEQQWLHESALLDGVARSGEREVVGHFEWTTEDFQAVTIGTQEYDAVFIPANEACYNRVSCKVPMTILQIERVFVNNAGDNDWNNPSNWSNGFVPPISNVSVTIAENVVIDSEVHVGSLKIEEGTEVTIAVTGHLTVDGYQETSTGNYGNMVVKEGGELTLNGTFKVNDFSIEASQGQSGQVDNPQNLDIQGEAYIDIKISDNAVLDENQWYGFTVPFPVDANTGVERIRPDGTIESGIVRDWDYAIATYNSQRRASGLSGWREFSGIMTPGVFYFLGIDGQSRIYRFHKTATGAMVSNDEMELNAYPADDPGDANWNAVGNPTLRYAHASCPVEFVQVYDNNTGAYSAVNINASTFVVGRPFFIQTGNGTLSLTAADGSHEAYYAPRRNQENKQNPIEVVLSAENGEACDNVFIRASEDATQDYVIGRDLVKLGTTTKKAQMWVNACGKKLCVREEVMRNNSANYSLNLYAPQDGEYNLNVENIPDGTELYLTYKGFAIWNLTYSPYTFDLSKGNTEGYGLKLRVNKVATGIEDVDGGEQNGVRKVLIDNTIYIVMPDGALYDINGKKVQ